MTNSETSAEHRLKHIFSPVITATALGVLLAGCGATETLNDKDRDDAMMSSSSSEMMQSSDADTMMSSQPSDAMMQSSAMMSEGAMHLYKDGTYTAAGVYQSPAGAESVHVTLVLKDDTVTDAMFTGDATHPKSMAMQKAFSEGFKEQVVGKPLDQVTVGVVNGSSLTGSGFMDAVTKIKTEAKA